MKFNYRFIILIAIILSMLVILLSNDPIEQDIAYHNFADQRIILGIPHFWDVVSNIPMFFIGLYALQYSLQTYDHGIDIVSKCAPFILAFGIFATSFGSAYYHWNPNNTTLIWDRLPMTLMFMPLLSMLIYDFMGKNIGIASFYILIFLGIGSVFYWYFTELAGVGDLRLYALVQFGSMILTPIIVILFYKEVPYLKWVTLILFWYILAKISEHFDLSVFALTNECWSGHTIKHLLGSVALFYVLKFLKDWRAGVGS